MSEALDVAVFVGSLRKGSYNRKVANALAELCRPSLNFEEVPIGEVSFYNQDLDTDAPPDDWRRLRERVQKAHAVLFVTPEYNRSVPGVLKNAIDIASRPYGKGALLGKPAAVVSVSIGAIGGFGANHHLRQTLVFLDMPTLAQPEAYVGNAQSLFDEGGALTNESTRKFLTTFAEAFTSWVQKHARAERT